MWCVAGQGYGICVLLARAWRAQASVLHAGDQTPGSSMPCIVAPVHRLTPFPYGTAGAALPPWTVILQLSLLSSRACTKVVTLWREGGEVCFRPESARAHRAHCSA